MIRSLAVACVLVCATTLGILREWAWPILVVLILITLCCLVIFVFQSAKWLNTSSPEARHAVLWLYGAFLFGLMAVQKWPESVAVGLLLGVFCLGTAYSGISTLLEWHRSSSDPVQNQEVDASEGSDEER